MTELLQQLLAWVAENPLWAHLIVFLVALTESLAVIGLIVPGVIIMIGAGALIATGALDFWPVCLWAVAGAVAGDGLSYWLGRHFKDRLKSVWPFTRYPEGLDTGVRFFEKYGGKSVAFGRFVGPVRAVIPLVAGMMGMSPMRFLLANVISALAWAPAYLLPGIVFGASLELAAEAAVRLVLLLLTLVILIWLVAWGVQQLFMLFSPRARNWVEGLLRWAEVHPRMGEVARALADPGHPDATTLASLAAVLILGTALFGLLAGLAVAGAPELALNQTVLDLFQSLRSPSADHLMAALSRLADVAVVLPLVFLVLAYLYWRGERRQASYWLAACAFALLAGPLLKVLIQVPRPDIGLTGLSPWAFPSSHTLRATVIYGFLAISIAGGMTPAWRWLPYVGASVLVVSVGMSRLYFGAHWLTDVIGSLTLGLVWIAALGLAFRRHSAVRPSWKPLGAISLATLMFAFAAQSLSSHDSDLALYRPQQDPISITGDEWREGFRSLPAQREDLRQTNLHPMNIQYAGSLNDLAQRLAARGWEPGEMLDGRGLVRLLSPSLPLQDLPVIPHVHDGRHEDLTLVKRLPDDGRLVLRLWATPYRIDGQTPLWIGNATAQRKRAIMGWFAIPVTNSDLATPFELLLQDIADLAPEWPAGDPGPVLLEI